LVTLISGLFSEQKIRYGEGALFPFSTPQAKQRLQTLSRLGLGWSLARLGYGCIALTTVLEGWLDLFQASQASYTVLLVLIFFCLEVVPIYCSLRNQILQSLSEGSASWSSDNDKGTGNKNDKDREQHNGPPIHNQRQQKPGDCKNPNNRCLTLTLPLTHPTPLLRPRYPIYLYDSPTKPCTGT
jgi:hypothetical protein